MRFTKNVTTTNATTELPGNYQAVEDAVQQPASQPVQRRTFSSRAATSAQAQTAQTSQNGTTVVAPTAHQVAPRTAPSQSVQHAQNHAGDVGKVFKILPKFVNRSPKAGFGSAVDFNASAFTLSKRTSAGYRDSMDGKFQMNFWTFDSQTNHMINCIPTYMDMSEWLNVCHMILSGRLHEETATARAKQTQGNYKYCGFVYQSNGGSYKPIFKLNGQEFGGKQGAPIATVFKITPAQKDNHWVLSSEIYEGVQEPTGLIAVKSGTKPLAKVQILMSYSDLVRVARMSEMAIQAFMNTFASQYVA